MIIKHRHLVDCSYKTPLTIEQDGKEIVYRIIWTCYKMDTQEYAAFAHTKNINDGTEYGCSKCNDKSPEMMNPKRISFHHPRNADEICEIAGINKEDNDLNETNCLDFDDWQEKGNGYVAIDLNVLPRDGEFEVDPSYAITTDIAHAMKNIVEQLVNSLMETEEDLQKRHKQLFNEMIAVCNVNHFDSKLMLENFADGPSYLSDITLELAPVALVL